MAKILVVDDEPPIRQLLDALLSLNGYDVILAESGKQGLEFYHRERPEVVVLDLNMPGMDGIAVLQQIRELNPDQPVIIFTGSVSAEIEQRLRAMGANEMIEKEFQSSRLLDTLKRLLKAPPPLLCA
jgi:CheY-like chemotaxis protein